MGLSVGVSLRRRGVKPAPFDDVVQKVQKRQNLQKENWETEEVVEAGRPHGDEHAPLILHRSSQFTNIPVASLSWLPRVFE